MTDEYATERGSYNVYDDDPNAVLTQPETNGRRLQRGRIVPARARRIVPIIVNDVVLGEVDADELTAGAQFDLEDCQTAHALVDWLVEYASADRDTAIAALRPMKAQALVDLLQAVSDALGQAVAVPKQKARR